MFEWDDAKAEQNFEKHGVDFLDAAQIFAGLTFEDADNDPDHGEERIRAIGQSEGVVYVVIYTWRDTTIRIISAWKANRHDRTLYHKALSR